MKTEAIVSEWVGREHTDAPGDIACERGYILHWLEATENANPLYWDESVAKDLTDGWIAPPSMLSVWMRPLQFVPGREETAMPLSLHFDLKEAFGLPDGVVSASEMILHAPVRIGDRITTTQSVRDISDEKTTRVGTGRFWTIDVTHRDQDGEVKGVETYEMFSYRPGGSGG
ncbi:MAG: MaoC family dehydratase N-terminal domain-containing protein [Actinomycetota bacterium]